eukprot:11193528-Lingulodinium_polyedra.AAC.1
MQASTFRTSAWCCLARPIAISRLPCSSSVSSKRLLFARSPEDSEAMVTGRVLPVLRYQPVSQKI